MDAAPGVIDLNADVGEGLAAGGRIEATLRGPSFPAQRLLGEPGRPLLLPGHEATVAVWCALVMILGNYGHCGAQTIHDAHHRTSRGNYGFFVLDRLLGTARTPARPRSRRRARPDAT